MGLDMYMIRIKKGTTPIYDDNEVAYWRKANAIHNWMVKNVQNNVDNCEYYPISKEQIESLKNLCEDLKSKVTLKKGKVVDYYYFNGFGKEIPHYIDGEVIENVEICKELLPTTSGFFFGSTDYDEWYYDQILNTIEQLDKILKETNFEEYEIYYTSSW